MLYEPGLGTLPFERDRLASDEPNVWLPLPATIMISTLEIGFALSVPLLVFAYVLTQPKPKPVRIRARDAQQRRGPHA
jgi:hypothetical protein